MTSTCDKKNGKENSAVLIKSGKLQGKQYSDDSKSCVGGVPANEVSLHQVDIIP